jgi:hypothetical protein
VTRRWREMDSNHRSRVFEAAFQRRRRDRFVADSSLEETRFEPSVPRKRTKVSRLPSFERSGRPPGSDQDSDPEYRPKCL